MTLDNLLQDISTRLNTLLDINVYSVNSALSQYSPYVVYNVQMINSDVRRRYDYILELDFWDLTKDSTNINTSANYVKNGRTISSVFHAGFDYSYSFTNDGFYHSYIEFDGIIPCQEPDKSRINQRYLLKVR